MGTYLALVVISLCVSLALTPLPRSLAMRVGVLDYPGERKLHTTPMPRLGGVSVVLSGTLTVIIVLWIRQVVGHGAELNLAAWWPALPGGILIFLVGIWDDLRSVPPWVKFLFQTVAAGVAIWLGVRIEHISLLGSGSLDLGMLSLPLTFLWIVGITNAFNLIDGLDGLATGLAIIATGASATILFLLGDTQDIPLLVILLGALLGFLPYNFNPATIFFGDCGSMSIGYVLAVTAIVGAQQGARGLAVVIPLLIFGLPIVDTLCSMVRRFVGNLRLLRAQNAPLKAQLLGVKCMFEPDQRHIHHRLLAIGFTHRNAVLLLYAMALGLSLLALLSVLAQYRNAGIILIAVGLATYIGIHKLGYDELTFLRTGTLLRWYEQFTFNRLFFLGFLDLILVTMAYWGAFLLKYDAPRATDLTTWYLNTFPFVLVAQLTIFYALGLYRGIWQAMGISDVIRMALAVLPAVVLSYVLALLNISPTGAFSFFCIDTLLLGLLVVGVRSAYRILDYIWQRENLTGGATLIYGAGLGGQLVLRELLQNPGLGLRPVGFLDDNPTLHGRTVNRVPVLGSVDNLLSIIETQSVSCLIISSSKVNGEHFGKAISVCEERHIPVLQGRLQLEPVGTNGLQPTTLTGQDKTRAG